MPDRAHVTSGNTVRITGASGGVGSALIQLANRRPPQGPHVEPDLCNLYLQDLTFTGATVTPPGLLAHLVRYIKAGEKRSLLVAADTLEQLRQAQQAFIVKRHVKNIVVTAQSDS